MLDRHPAAPVLGSAVRLTTPGLTKDESRIFTHLHDAIVEQRLAPGVRLVEEELSAIYRVSRMRIRRVLLSLAHAGVITLSQGRGALVARPSQAEARAVFASRVIIEAGLLAQHRTALPQGEIAALRRIVAAGHAAAERHDHAALIQFSGRFHIELARILGNEVIVEIVAGLVARSSLIIALYQRATASCCRGDDHVELTELLAAGSFAEAACHMRDHLQAIEANLNFTPESAQAPDLRRILLAGEGQEAPPPGPPPKAKPLEAILTGSKGLALSGVSGGKRP